VDYYLSNGLGVENPVILDVLGENEGYGRVGDVNLTAGEILQNYKREFKTDKVLLYGDSNKKITRIASFCGAGLGAEEVGVAIENGANMVVSADIPHHVLLLAIERGLSVLNCSHYSSENYGMKMFAENIGKQINQKIYFFDDERFA
jgi:putative NIF3 family GTP cyclohydrolase 1 type 2